MAIDNFIPEVWVDSMLDRWTDQSVLTDLVNRDYEGEATRGNTVHLTGAVAPEIHDYKANGRTTDADEITDTAVDLLIDQEKNFDFYVDDIDRTQAAGSLDIYTDAAADQLVLDANRFIGATLASQGTALTGTIPATGDAAFNLVRDARKALNKALVPFANRILLINSEFEGLLVGADSKLTSFDTSGDSAGLREATVGRLLQFRVVVSDSLPETDSPAFAAFHSRAAAFVSQIDRIEALRATNKFADRIRGLHVYGGKVIKPEGVQVFGITQGTLTGTPASEAWDLAITGAPTGGTYTLTVGTTATAAIAYNATNSAIAAALNALSGVSDAAVTGSATKRIAFKSAVKLTATGSFTGGTAPAVTVTAA